MNPANRLGGVVAVTVVTFLSLAGVVLGAAFIFDNTRSDDYVDMETVEMTLGSDQEPGASDWVELEPYYEYSTEEDLPDFEFGFRSPRFFSDDWVEIDPDYRFRIYPDEDGYSFFDGEERLAEDWVEFESPEFTLRGYVVPSDEFDGRERWFGDYRGTTDELMDDLLNDWESFGFDEIEPEVGERFREIIERFFERAESDEFYLYIDDEEDEE